MLIPTQVRKFAYKNLIQRAKTHTKSSKIAEKSSFKNVKTQRYLKHPEISKEDGQILFASRTRSIDLKNNYKQLYNNDTKCRLCLEEDSAENESHLLHCFVLCGEVRQDEKNISYNGQWCIRTNSKNRSKP